MTASSPATDGRRPVGVPGAVTPLCWSAVLLDGYDLVVLGTVIPVLVGDSVFGLTDASATAIATTGLVGMTIGAMTIGTVTDVLGRRKVMIFAALVFSVFTLACAIAPNAFLFGTFRFLAGLGLGGCLPTAITLATEFAAKGKSAGKTTLIMTGYHVGAVLTALLGLLVLGNGGSWRWMFVLGGIPGLILVPLMVKMLPESVLFLEQQAAAKPNQKRENPIAGLFQNGLARPTLAFWATSFLGLILVYGLNTWLPKLMVTAGYPLTAGLGLLLTLNGGAIVGLLVAGQVANRIGVRPATLVWFGLGAVLLAALSIKLPQGGLYVAVFLAGMFVFSAQVLIYAFVGQVYPASMRGAALGWTAGVGRIGAITGPIIIGAMLSTNNGYPGGFYVFAGIAAAAVLTTLVVGHPRDVVDSEVAEHEALVHH